MASAVLARTTTTTSGASFMGKIPFANPNPNPKFSHKRQPKHVAAGEIIIDESLAVTRTASDDASSINHHRRHNKTTTATATASRCITFNVGSYTKKELKELKKRFSVELEQIRQLKYRIDSFQSIPNNPQPPQSHPPSSKKKSMKKLSGNKRPLPSNSSKDLNLKRSHLDNTNLMKNCGQILTKLMKHKHGWIFNTPVDVDSQGLHDYYDIIKSPMDLGTVKSRVSKGFYPSPLDFAADVRLTFGNALTYNPKGHDVYAMAEQLLARFEELFRPIGEMLEFRPSNQQQQQQQQQQQDRVFDEDEELQASSWNDLEESFVPVAKKSSSENEDGLLQRGLVPTDPNPMPTVQSPVRTPSPMKAPHVKPLKQPKPKAKDPNKREMSMEEKHKLGTGLQSLPPEKMEQVVQIIRKRNGNLKQDGDEIELDIEAVDTETLWELDRLVTNWKKMVSKIKRQALMGNNLKNNGEELAMSERIDVVASEAKKPKKGEAGEEDVDIGDEMPVGNFPPVEIEKDVGGGHASSSSSSSSSSDSDSSSSSDSDSGSSSGSDSDADNAQS